MEATATVGAMEATATVGAMEAMEAVAGMIMIMTAMIGEAIMLGMVIMITMTIIVIQITIIIVIQITIIIMIDTLEVHAIPIKIIIITTTNHMDITLTIKATLLNVMEDTKDTRDTMEDTKDAHINRAIEDTKDAHINRAMVDAHIKDSIHVTTAFFITQTMVMKTLMFNKTTAITTMMLKDLILEKFGQLEFKLDN